MSTYLPKVKFEIKVHVPILDTFSKMNQNTEITIFLKKLLQFIIFLINCDVLDKNMKIYILLVSHNQYINNVYSRYLFSTYWTYCWHAR